MPREQLLGLASEVGRLLAAGSSAAAGHDGLARRARALRELGAKVPTLAAVADAVERVTAAPPKQGGPAFLDLVVLARQIRGSLTSAGADGALEAVPASGPWTAHASLRDVGPVYEALTHSGEAREQTLKDAVERKIVGDLRLLPALLEGLSDGYAPVADLVAGQALPALGKAALPDVLARLDLQGKTADARALVAVCKIDPARGAELCRKALEEGSMPLRIQALGCLPDVGKPGEAERVGLELCQAKARDLRLAAIGALRAGQKDETLETLVTLLKDKDAYVCRAAQEALIALPHPQTTPRLLRELEAVLTALPPPPKKKPGKQAGKQAILKATRGRGYTEADRQVEDAVHLVRVVGEREDQQRLGAARAVLPLGRHYETSLRLAALEALGRIGPVTGEVVPTLQQVLDEKDTVVVATALEALERIAPAQREEAVGRVLELLEGRKLPDEVSHAAVRLLPPHTGRYGPRVLAALAAALKGKDWRSRYAVTHALIAIGPPARPILPDVLEHLRKGELHPLRNVLPVLDPEGEEAIPAAVRWLQDRKKEARVAALQTLLQYGPKAAPATEAVRKCLEDKDRWVHSMAEAALSAIQDGV
jgi:HEAT repeat protein